jgi:hypothetical protein
MPGIEMAKSTSEFAPVFPVELAPENATKANPAEASIANTASTNPRNLLVALDRPLTLLIAPCFRERQSTPFRPFKNTKAPK